MMIDSVVWAQYIYVTERQPRRHSKCRLMHWHRAAKTAKRIDVLFGVKIPTMRGKWFEAVSDKLLWPVVLLLNYCLHRIKYVYRKH